MSQTRGRQVDPHRPEVWITGLGLVSSLGEGPDAHWAALSVGKPGATVDETRFEPYPVHPLAAIDFSKQIERKGDIRQMGQWQRIGVHAAGLALEDAGLAGDEELLGKTDLVVAAGNGERDEAADANILEALTNGTENTQARGSVLNRLLQTSFRPTLYLAELSNLLAGNIQIVHGVAGSSRTYKGEEMAGVSAVEDAVRRIAGGQGQLFLVGGAFNAERADLGLVFELCGALWPHSFKPVWRRAEDGGGFIMGSLGAFLVLESETHAMARGKQPYARISCIHSGRGAGTSGSPRGATEALEALARELHGPLGILSGVSGAEPATSHELEWITMLDELGLQSQVRAYGTMLGHSVEAHFPAGVALAGLAVSKQALYEPFDDTGREEVREGHLDRVLVTGRGHWRGEGFALVEAAAKQ